MSSKMIVEVKTPSWARERFPQGTTLLRLDGTDELKKWFLLIWNETHAVMSLDPNVWMPVQESLFADDTVMEMWYPPYPHIFELLKNVARQAYMKHTPAKMGIKNLIEGKQPEIPDVELAWLSPQSSMSPVQTAQQPVQTVQQQPAQQKVFDLPPLDKKRATPKKSTRRRKKK